MSASVIVFNRPAGRLMFVYYDPSRIRTPPEEVIEAAKSLWPEISLSVHLSEWCDFGDGFGAIHISPEGEDDPSSRLCVVRKPLMTTTGHQLAWYPKWNALAYVL